MSQTEDLARLVQWTFSELAGGELARRRQRSGLPASAIAAAAGCTVAEYYAFETGVRDPEPGRALAILDTFRKQAPNFGTAAARSQAAEAERVQAEQDERDAARAAVEASW